MPQGESCGLLMGVRILDRICQDLPIGARCPRLQGPYASRISCRAPRSRKY